ncbi:rhodanese-like domain-containing protein [Furfurilactobacillus siliginis]|uniref:Rhodanese domain-containing protein n=1 Tax=Furfurilactobacillus siliginis TaxID=348151 RepID=A0A0R2L3Q8_9LACO|nr:rhodanese-like domain-containing protein [Furfurilactobacillus siliginis]KRN96383.1 hypothetical protein IV55_GL001347 [Furfurilactobacillus siliginis]GEK29008.1 hypothetical protein LSI01_13190 [Furfurilactobacillus siliginis]
MKTVDVHELHDNLPIIGQLLDVREADEFSEGHVPTAINRPLSQINAWLSELSDKVIYTIICRSGRRSALAIEQMQLVGIDGSNVTGGTLAWQAAGFATVTE